MHRWFTIALSHGAPSTGMWSGARSVFTPGASRFKNDYSIVKSLSIQLKASLRVTALADSFKKNQALG